ncbi:MAG: FtsX-like permease family protein [Rhodospirillaceae bacterium]|jgi:putative ABC transport system permease protein|nr:FtsX-like permease family protein [Rhodospirillaceae bacterium]MBT5244495.1 FtsX-like permease family protein [Rhodospirillaceae bacterium]MBT5560752.1 FtsX-like permease family protein [Rhodospirillaceae bacterium]MBT6242418.1 FtsX-like permease family protein [Rhodospirillaceae bacterium]MBT7136377.1 FtsX-like permease family protein [Rhodospirillaceae bacterium]
MGTSAAWTLAWSLARRELRAGLAGFRIFLACLGVGVAAIAAVGTISASVIAGLNNNAKNLLGGDFDLRFHNHANSEDQDRYLMDQTRSLSKTLELRAMATPAAGTGAGKRGRSLIELKGVDDAYPLSGNMVLAPALTLDDALAKQTGDTFGAVADANLLKRLGLDLGGRVKVGAATLSITAIIKSEPDRVASVLSFGPRLMVSMAALEKTGLIRPGSQAHFHTRVLLAAGVDPEVWRENLNTVFPKAGWRVRQPNEAAPGIRRFIDRMTLFLSFVGLTALLVGGIGVTNAVGGYLDGKTATIATFKCVGAPGALVFKIYLLQVMVLSVLGIGVGLIFGGIIPAVGLGAVASQMPVAPDIGFYPKPLALAAVFGLLTSLTFAMWPLGRAREIPAATLFRDAIAPSNLKPGPAAMIAAIAGVAALAGLTIMSASDRYFSYWFVGGALVTVGLLRLGAALLVGWATRMKSPKNAELRLALANIHRPGSNAPSVVLSLGLGLSVLVAVALIQGNLNYQVNERLPEEAPAFFFIDIQPGQVAAFDETVTRVAGTKGFRRMPSLRGRIVKIDGTPVEKATVAPGSQWAINGDRALTSSANPTEGSKIIEGEWWDEAYSGPPVISLDAGLAKGFGIGIGDTLTLNVLGREIEGTIMSLREIDWRSLRFDFAIILAPGPLEGAPHTHIAAVEAPAEIEEELEDAVSSRFANITSIRVREALEAAAHILEGIGQAVQGTSLITIIAGSLVLAGTLAAGQRRRIYDAVIFKVLGATRGRLLKAFAFEYGILGIATGIISAAIGTLTAWAVMVFLMRAGWIFLPQVVAITVAICLFVTVVAGYLGTWKALGETASTHLRNK